MRSICPPIRRLTADFSCGRLALLPGMGDTDFEAMMEMDVHAFTYNQGMPRVVQAQLVRAAAASRRVSVLVWHELKSDAGAANDNWRLCAGNVLCCLRYFRYRSLASALAACLAWYFLIWPPVLQCAGQLWRVETCRCQVARPWPGRCGRGRARRQSECPPACFCSAVKRHYKRHY